MAVPYEAYQPRLTNVLQALIHGDHAGLAWSLMTYMWKNRSPSWRMSLRATLSSITRDTTTHALRKTPTQHPSKAVVSTPPFMKNCHACGRFGHPAVRCNFLAKYAHMLEYWKTKDPKEVKLAQEHWLERNKKWLDGDHRTPRKVTM